MYWTQQIKQDHPEVELIIEGETFKGLLNKDVAVSVTAQHH